MNLYWWLAQLMILLPGIVVAVVAAFLVPKGQFTTAWILLTAASLTFLAGAAAAVYLYVQAVRWLIRKAGNRR